MDSSPITCPISTRQFVRPIGNFNDGDIRLLTPTDPDTLNEQVNCIYVSKQWYEFDPLHTWCFGEHLEGGSTLTVPHNRGPLPPRVRTLLNPEFQTATMFQHQVERVLQAGDDEFPTELDKLIRHWKSESPDDLANLNAAFSSTRVDKLSLLGRVCQLNVWLQIPALYALGYDILNDKGYEGDASGNGRICIISPLAMACTRGSVEAIYQLGLIPGFDFGNDFGNVKYQPDMEKLISQWSSLTLACWMNRPDVITQLEQLQGFNLANDFGAVDFQPDGRTFLSQRSAITVACQLGSDLAVEQMGKLATFDLANDPGFKWFLPDGVTLAKHQPPTAIALTSEYRNEDTIEQLRRIVYGLNWHD